MRVVAVGNNKNGDDDPCNFHKHNDKKCPEGYPSHHIIQDMFFRIGGRSSLLRPNGAPTLGDGMSICLEKDSHRDLHDAIDARLEKLGPTANLFDLADISADELKKILNAKGLNCDDEIDAVRDKFKNDLGSKGRELLGRSANKLGRSAEDALRGSWGLPPK
ncbi:hypothetical protein [Rhodovulum kholense]|uniref:hypothetical protein n=1 Tax=Rhodovulum kholense TaxID=453584 RepID=UPI0011B229F5|nr:hypothetical protein [Rhodovulum kholense]